MAQDGSRCQGCGELFGMWRRRQICGSCDRYFCGACLGAFTIAGIGCFCGSRCAQCRQMGQRSSLVAKLGHVSACFIRFHSGLTGAGEFESIRSKMEA